MKKSHPAVTDGNPSSVTVKKDTQVGNLAMTVTDLRGIFTRLSRWFLWRYFTVEKGCASVTCRANNAPVSGNSPMPLR